MKPILGIGAILIALGNLALLEFGPEKAASLTVGDAAGIAGSMILAFSGFVVIRG